MGYHLGQAAQLEVIIHHPPTSIEPASQQRESRQASVVLTTYRMRSTAQQDAALDVNGRMRESKHVSRGEVLGGPATQNSRLQGHTGDSGVEVRQRKRPYQDSRLVSNQRQPQRALNRTYRSDLCYS